MSTTRTTCPFSLAHSPSVPSSWSPRSPPVAPARSPPPAAPHHPASDAPCSRRACTVHRGATPAGAIVAAPDAPSTNASLPPCAARTCPGAANDPPPPAAPPDSTSSAVPTTAKSLHTSVGTRGTDAAVPPSPVPQSPTDDASMPSILDRHRLPQ